jgi:hypothetical protein
LPIVYKGVVFPVIFKLMFKRGKFHTKERIEKLVAIVTIVFFCAYLIGIYLLENHKPIRILNNGRMAKCYFKYGSNFIAKVLLNVGFQSNIDIFKFLSNT